MSEFNFDAKALDDIQNGKYTNVHMRITSTCNGRVWSIERNDDPNTSRILSSIANESSSLLGVKSRTTYIHGSDLEAFLKHSFSLEIDKDNKGDELLAQNKRAQSFMKAVRRGRLLPTLIKFRRGTKKAAILGRGLQALERQGKKGLVLSEDYWLEALSPDHAFVTSEVKQRYNKWLASGSEDHFFEWDLANRAEGAEPPTVCEVKYLEKGVRDQYRIKFQDGKFYRKGEVFDTANERTEFSGGGTAIFVIGPDGFYSGSHSVGEFHHSSFLSGGAVLGAGEIKTNSEGQIISISNKSGHYKPGKGELINALKFLQGKGVDLSSVELQELHPAGEQFSLGVQFIYSSALEYLDNMGDCPMGTIYSSSNNKRFNLDMLQELQDKGLDLSSVKFKESNPMLDEFSYSALEYFNTGGKCLPWDGERIKIQRDDNDQIISINSDSSDKCLNMERLEELQRRGLDLSLVRFQEPNPQGGQVMHSSALEYLDSAILDLFGPLM